MPNSSPSCSFSRGPRTAGVAEIPYTLVVAMAANRVIGMHNAMPWHVPEDLQRFKKLTMGLVILMGGNTFRSLPRVLPGRYHIVVSRRQHAPHPQLAVVGSLQAAHQMAQRHAQQQQHRQIMVVGGAQIYTHWLARASRIAMTEIHHNFTGDSFFPQLETNQWQPDTTQAWRTSSTGLQYRFVSWQRR